MRIQGSLIIILFVEHEDPWVLRGAVEDIGMIARLLPHFGHRNPHDTLELLLRSSLHCQLGSESEHSGLLAEPLMSCEGQHGDKKTIPGAEQVKPPTTKSPIVN